MATIVLTCPRCLAENQTLDLAPIFKLEKQNTCAYLAAFCRKCNKPSGLFIKGRGDIVSASTSKLGSPVDITNQCEVLEVSPPIPRPDIPVHLPQNIEQAFLEAEQCRVQQSPTAAGMMYRRALELATKDKGRDLEQTIRLKTRIRTLAAAGRLTSDLADWADHIREEGNEAAHEESPPATADIEALANLTRMMLVYLYEMPERVRQMREDAQRRGIEAM